MSRFEISHSLIGRVLVLTAALALGGCGLTTSTVATNTQPAPNAAPDPAAAPAPAGAPPVAGPPAAAAPAAAPRPIAAARGQSPPPPPPPAEEPAEPYTVEKARGECWMKLEGDKKVPRDPEKRIPYVQKCVAEKMAQQPKQ